jgi:hypothetical protein
VDYVAVAKRELRLQPREAVQLRCALLVCMAFRPTAQARLAALQQLGEHVAHCGSRIDFSSLIAYVNAL